LPAGASGSVVLTGADGQHTISESGTVTLACGSYAVSAPVATTSDPRIRKAYAPTLSSNMVEVCGGAVPTLSANWSLIPTSNKIFFAEGNGNIDVVGFAADQLDASGDVLVTISGSTRGRATGDAFDKQGNLWVSVPGSHEVVRLDAASLVNSGAVTPATTTCGSIMPATFPD
jgi:hypothetical protein